MFIEERRRYVPINSLLLRSIGFSSNNFGDLMSGIYIYTNGKLQFENAEYDFS